MNKKGYTAFSSAIIAGSLLLPTMAHADDVPEAPSLPDSYVSGGTGTLQVEFQPIPQEARTKIFEREETPTVSEEPRVSDTPTRTTPRTVERTVTVVPEEAQVSHEEIILPPEWEGIADGYVDQLRDSMVTLQPTNVSPPTTYEGLSSSLSSMVPEYDSDVAQKVIDYAYTQLGVPYVWGGTSSFVGLDCSGLTQNAYAAAGISIPRVTYDQINSGTHVSVNNIQPGDLVFYNNTQHVALYIGGGQVIHAPYTGTVVSIDSLTMMPVQAVVRPFQ